MKIQTKTLLIFIVSLFLLNVTIAAESVFPLLERYIKQQQYIQAYQQAIKLRLDNEGDPRFDYLYGLSALQTGHYNEAVFALDRVTVSTPNVIRPRLELARAYLKLNNKSAAIKEFNDVLRLSPPPAVRQNVQVYIAKLEKKGSTEIARQSITKRLASFSIGYDDNINFGYDGNEIDVPLFGFITLDDSSVKQKSGFAEAKFQIKHRKIMDKTKSSFFLANLTHKKYFKSSDFDLTDLDLRAGMTLNRGKRQYQFVARTRPVVLDGELHSNTLGLDVVTRKALGAGSVASIQFSADKYDNKKLSESDRKRAVLSARLDKQINEIQHQFNLYWGKEWPDEDEGKKYSRDILGVGYLVAKEWNEKNRSSIGLDYRHYKHQGTYPVYPDNKRKDDQTILKVSHEWQINDKAALIFSARHIRNDSNLELYETKRNEIKVGMRYDWD